MVRHVGVYAESHCHIDVAFEVLPENPELFIYQEFPSNEIVFTFDSDDHSLAGTE